MKTLKIILVVTLIMTSCANNDYSITYYSNGQIKEKVKLNKLGHPEGLFEGFYENGQKKIKGYFRNSHLNDTLRTYYQNGNLNEVGYFLKDYKSGWWHKYNKNGKLKAKKEYIIVNDTVSLLNQNIYYNSDEKIDTSKSVFFNVNLPDTLKKGVNIGSLDYYSRTKASKSYLYVIIENEKNKSIVQDTFADRSNYTEFAVVVKDLGKQTISGDIVEQLIFLEEMKNDSTVMRIENRFKRFTKSVYVKESE